MNKKSAHQIPKLIAEIKPASPVTGRLLIEDVSIKNLAAAYEAAGASALSILTDTKFFQGSFSNLQLAQSGTQNIPLLCKDFIICSKQVRLARKHGANSLLLIAKILEVDEIQELLLEGRKYNMEALVEIADQADLHKIEQTDCKLVGINNRNLHDFSLDISATFRLAKQLRSNQTVVSLSGFAGADVRLVKSVADAVLVGSSIGKQITNTSQQAEIDTIFDEYTKPKSLVKLCGVRTLQDAKLAALHGADLLGINFVPNIKRTAPPDLLSAIENNLIKTKNMKLVGVFQNQSAEFVQKMCSKYRLLFAQLSGDESAVDFTELTVPIIKGVSVRDNAAAQRIVDEWTVIADLFLFDGKQPGSGKPFNYNLLPQTKLPFLVAGGINPQNAAEVLQKTAADGVDTASGIEDETGEWAESAIIELLQSIRS